MPATSPNGSGPLADPTEPIVVARDLHKIYPGGIHAVRGVSFEVYPGEVFGLLGPNGAGKSTTIGMLTTTVTPSRGSARLAGHDVAADPIAARSVSSVVFQDSVVDRGLSGTSNLLLHARLWGVPAGVAAARIAALGDSFGLRDVLARPVDSYSGGQRRRLEIARALVSEPQVLFLDEPTVGLDTRIRFELLDLIAGLRGRTGMTTVLTTHYLDEAERLCDRVAIVHGGQIVALDAPARLLAGLGEEIIEIRVNADGDDTLTELQRRGGADRRAFAVGSTLTVPLERGNAGAVLSHVEDLGLAPESITTRRPTLDDVYLQLTGDRLAA
jgi:ABC-2 type transport system ATP-binding protein